MGQKFVVLIALCFAVLVVDDNNAAEASNLKRLTGKALSAVARWRSKYLPEADLLPDNLCSLLPTQRQCD